MKKCLLFLISLVLLFASSCIGDSKTQTITIDWVVVHDISHINFRETPVRLQFNEGYETMEFQLIPNNTHRISVRDGLQFSGLGRPWDIEVEFFPNAWELLERGKMEIFLYDSAIIEQAENSVTLLPSEKILMYIYTVIWNDRRYQFFSRSNRINTDTDSLSNIDVSGYLWEEILEMMAEKKINSFYASGPIPISARADPRLRAGEKVILVGFIVKSRLGEGLIRLGWE